MSNFVNTRAEWPPVGSSPVMGGDVGFAEAFGNAYNEQIAAWGVFSLEQGFIEQEQKYLDQVYETTGQRVPPLNTSALSGRTRPYLEVARHFEDGTPLPEEYKTHMSRLDELRKFNPSVPSYADIWKATQINAADVEGRAAAEQQRPGGFFSSTLGGFLGGAVGSFNINTDPGNVATLGIGGIGRSIFTRIATEMGAAGAVEGINQLTGVQEGRRLLGLEYGFNQAVSQIALTAAGAGGIRAVGETIGAGWRTVRGRKAAPKPKRKTPAQRADSLQKEVLDDVIKDSPYGKDPADAKVFADEIDNQYDKANTWADEPDAAPVDQNTTPRQTDFERRVAERKAKNAAAIAETERRIDDLSKPKPEESPLDHDYNKPTEEFAKALPTFKTTQDAAKWIGDNAKEPELRAIAKRIHSAVEKGVTALGQEGHMGFRLYRRGQKRPADVSASAWRGVTNTLGHNRALAVWSPVSGVTVPAKGVSERAVLHELVHAATGFAIQKGHRAAAKFPAEAKLVKSITDLQLQIRQHRGLIGFKSDKKHPARELFNYIGADRWRDFTTNPHELLTYGLTDPWVQHILKSIPLDGPKKATVWSAFVDALRKYLGIPKGEHTALSAIIDLSEKIFDANIPGGRSTRDLDIRYPAPRATEPDAKRIKQEREKLDRLYKQRDALERAGKLTDQTKAPDVEVADKTAARMDIAETEADDVAEAFQSQRDAPEIEVGGFKVKRGEEIIDPDTGNKTTVGRLMKDMDEDDAALEAATQCKVSL